MPKEKQKKDERDQDRDKRLVMWSGVSFFMFLIVFLWFLNIRSVLSNTDSNNTSQFNLKEFSEEFNKTFEGIRETMEALEEEEEEEVESVSVEKEEEIDKENITALKGILEASSSTTTINN